MGRIGKGVVKGLKGAAKVGKKVANSKAVRGVANHVLSVGLGSNNVTVEGISAAAKAKGAKGKARAFGRLTGDAALGRLSDGHVKLRDFSGSKQDIAKRLGRKALSYGLAKASGGALDYKTVHGIVQHPTDTKAWTKVGTNLAKAQVKKYEKQLLLGNGSSEPPPSA
jgi:hypothetical protein